MELKPLVQILWIAGMVCQAVLAGVLLFRKTWKAFPIFSLYFYFTFAATVFIFAIQHYRKLYLYSYWLQEAVGIALGFAVVYEVFQTLFGCHPALRKLAKAVFCGVLVVLACIGVTVLIKRAPLGFASFTFAVLTVEEVARIIELGLLMSLFVLSTTFGLHWRQQVFGIALGLGLFLAVELITITVRAQLGNTAHDALHNTAHDALNIVRVVAFNTSLLIWLGYLLSPERASSNEELPHRSQLEQWNQAVMELIRQ